RRDVAACAPANAWLTCSGEGERAWLHEGLRGRPPMVLTAPGAGRRFGVDEVAGAELVGGWDDHTRGQRGCGDGGEGHGPGHLRWCGGEGGGGGGGGGGAGGAALVNLPAG